jgi:hypothetical protein
MVEEFEMLLKLAAGRVFRCGTIHNRVRGQRVSAYMQFLSVRYLAGTTNEVLVWVPCLIFWSRFRHADTSITAELMLMEPLIVIQGMVGLESLSD